MFNWLFKSKRTNYKVEPHLTTMNNAIKEAMDSKDSVAKVARKHGIPERTLRRHVLNFKQNKKNK